jgi:hypothetical protein
LGPNGYPVAVLRDNRVFYRLGSAAEWRAVSIMGEHFWFATSRDANRIAVSTINRLHQFCQSDPTSIWDTDLRGVARFDFTPDGRRLALLDADGLRCFESASGEVCWSLPRVAEYMRVADVAWSADGRWLAAHCNGGTYR